MYLVNKKRDGEPAAAGVGGLDGEKERIERTMRDLTELDNPGSGCSL